jgi:outer membrane biosynthesis protein TonB
LLACKHEPDAASTTPGAAATPPPTDGTMNDAAAGSVLSGDTTDAATSTADLGDAASAAEAAAPVSAPDLSAPPGYPAASLKDTFAKNADKLKACYLPGKKRDPKLRGKVIVKFSIGTSGRVGFAQNEGSNLQDDAVIACVVKAVKSLRFTKPLEGSVTVVYPFIFRPGDETLILPESAPAK